MARKRDQIMALILASVFLFTSVIVGLLVVWQATSNDNNNVDTAAVEDVMNQGENMLQGTKLEDFEPIQSVDELRIIDITEGTGQEVKPGDTVTVDYTGAVAATGEIFQSSLDFGQQATFSLDGVIAGWTEGIPGMKEGGKRRLIIPAEKAYGANPPAGSNIPADAALVFDVTLFAVGESAQE